MSCDHYYQYLRPTVSLYIIAIHHAEATIHIVIATFLDFTEPFKGTKSLVVSNLNDLEGKNHYLGVSYILVGSLSLLLGFSVRF